MSLTLLDFLVLNSSKKPEKQVLKNIYRIIIHNTYDKKKMKINSYVLKRNKPFTKKTNIQRYCCNYQKRSHNW